MIEEKKREERVNKKEETNCTNKMEAKSAN
jgi:hypothetical protein